MGPWPDRHLVPPENKLIVARNSAVLETPQRRHSRGRRFEDGKGQARPVRGCLTEGTFASPPGALPAKCTFQKSLASVSGSRIQAQICLIPAPSMHALQQTAVWMVKGARHAARPVWGSTAHLETKGSENPHTPFNKQNS